MAIDTKRLLKELDTREKEARHEMVMAANKDGIGSPSHLYASSVHASIVSIQESFKKSIVSDEPRNVN